MYLTKAEVFSLPPAAFLSVLDLIHAISNRWACGISVKTANRIIRDYAAR